MGCDVEVSQVHCIDSVFNVQNFGAFPDGKTDNNQAFLKAWNQICQSNAGGTLFIPTGTFLLNAITFNGPCKGPTYFNINGVLRAPIGKCKDEYWILFQHINGLTINGNGSLDGQGPSSWSLYNANTQNPPASIKFNGMSNALIQDIASINSKFFHFQINNCKGVHFRNVNITAPGDSPNTDGIHIGNSNDIIINKSNISTGDDCISIGPGSSNIHISEVNCGPGHGISIGSLGKYQNEADVNGVIVTNCTIVKTQNGVRIKSWAPSPPSKVYNVTFENIKVNYVKNPIVIDQHYCPHSSCSNQGDSQVKISDVQFTNIKGTSASKVGVVLDCSKSVPCQGIELKGLDLTFNGQGTTTATCSNANMTFYGQQTPSHCA
ncbi:exopolygalacturonase-like [Solanum dulcamara]|uniref:exopolygalacturonase-like n=1 Tax=Solanum dulcamara TaxID=45834 RepID=UPI00248658F4|nr:exopolygalacturonase-like [Solanum dulcamara]